MSSPGGLAEDLCRNHRLEYETVPVGWPGHGIRGTLGFFWALARLVRELRAQRPTVLLPFTPLANTACGLAWRCVGSRLCVWNQRDAGIDLDGYWPRLALRLAPVVVSNSQHAAEMMRQRFGVPASRIEVIHNGVELPATPEGHSQWRARLRIRPGDFWAAMPANLTAYKDHDTLLHAWAEVVSRLRRSGLRAMLALPGRLDAASSHVTSRVLGLGLAEHVAILGPATDIPGLLSCMDLLVFSSKLEGVPNAVLEGMAAGLPVAASDIPGIREAVGTSGFPFLAHPGDSEALARVIITLAGDGALRRRIGDANRQRIAEEFSIRRANAAWVSLLARRLGLRCSPGAS